MFKHTKRDMIDIAMFKKGYERCVPRPSVRYYEKVTKEVVNRCVSINTSGDPDELMEHMNMLKV